MPGTTTRRITTRTTSTATLFSIFRARRDSVALTPGNDLSASLLESSETEVDGNRPDFEEDPFKLFNKVLKNDDLMVVIEFLNERRIRNQGRTTQATTAQVTTTRGTRENTEPLAAHIGDEAVVQVLSTARKMIEERRIIDEKMIQGWTCLHIAAIAGRWQLAQALIKGGSSIDAVTSNACTPLHFAHTSAIANVLVRAGAKIDARNQHGNTPLYLAVCNRDKGVVAELIKNGAEIDARNQHGNKALYRAAYNGDVETTTALLSAGATLDPEMLQRLRSHEPETHVEISALEATIHRSTIATRQSPEWQAVLMKALIANILNSKNDNSFAPNKANITMLLLLSPYSREYFGNLPAKITQFLKKIEKTENSQELANIVNTWPVAPATMRATVSAVYDAFTRATATSRTPSNPTS